MSFLGELLFSARKREREKTLLPLWMVNYAIAKARGGEIMNFETLVNESMQQFEPGKAAASKSKRTSEEIMAEFAPLVEADRKRGADG